MSGVILVTGATGNVGREVLRELIARGAAARAAVYNPVSYTHLDVYKRRA